MKQGLADPLRGSNNGPTLFVGHDAVAKMNTTHADADAYAELFCASPRLLRHCSTLLALLSGVAVNAALDENAKRIRDTIKKEIGE